MGVPAVPIGRRVPVVVIGASLAGLAVAGRLALVGHRVVLHERRDRISALAPSVIDLPAAWRDSFRKSGRPLDLELQTLGLQWRPAPPTDYGVLLLPHSRGEQWETLGTRWGEPVARRWQDFLDSTDQVWQAMRPLGIESELSDPRLDRRTRQAIGWRRSLADLAAALHHDGLAELLTAIAAEHDTDPRWLPGWYATRHSIRRTFGRWQLVDAHGRTDNQALVGLLRRRLDKRGVELRLGSAIDSPSTVTPAELAAAAVVDCTGGDRIDWRGRRTWVGLEPTTREPGRYYAGPRTRAGSEPWAQLMSAAVAAYAVHSHRTGEDIRPVRKATPRRRLI
ncbi:NAD(P)-binding protein [Naumannella halotolerans]|uniref:NAD(P)-binding protein n=1 Tax=Naumannella halotolerans TaxID=993414 RepID=UPI00370D3777